jgi:LSD1 subclass zinc finger protein
MRSFNASLHFPALHAHCLLRREKPGATYATRSTGRHHATPGYILHAHGPQRGVTVDDGQLAKRRRYRHAGVVGDGGRLRYTVGATVVTCTTCRALTSILQYGCGVVEVVTSW